MNHDISDLFFLKDSKAIIDNSSETQNVLQINEH